MSSYSSPNASSSYESADSSDSDVDAAPIIDQQCRLVLQKLRDLVPSCDDKQVRADREID